MALVRLVRAAGIVLGATMLVSWVACSFDSRQSEMNTIRVTGSDTMINLANAWKEAFEQTHPDIGLQVKGGGSGIGIAALCDGKIEIATASRAMKPKEIETAKEKTGKEPKQFVVGQDALAIYVHPDNPIETISIPELAQIYGAEGKVKTWPELGIDNKACPTGEIIVVSRQNSSGTYAYFKEAVLGEKGEYRQGMTAQPGSSELASLISRTPCAIGYSGMGYKTPEVKFLKIAKEKGGPGVAATVENALDGSYPITRPLYLYTLGEPTGAIAEFIHWVQGDEGQKLVEELGYVPLPK